MSTLQEAQLDSPSFGKVIFEKVEVCHVRYREEKKTKSRLIGAWESEL